MDDWQPQAWSGLQNNQSCWPAASSTFLDLIHDAFPKPRRTSRISKPHSTAPRPYSPPSSSATKRRATTTSSSTAAMPQQNPVTYRHPTPSPAYQAKQERPSRPMSWHPAGHSTQQYIPPSTASTAASINLSAMALPPSLNDAPLYGEGNDSSMLPPSYSLSDLPIPHDSYSSLSGMQDPLSSSSSSLLPMDATASQPLPDSWTFDMMPMHNTIPSVTARSTYESVPSSGGVTGPSTPDLLPIQPHEDYSQLPDFTKDTDDELVGMGLYNQPESFLGSSNQGVLGKGLKLEETFTPSSNSNENNMDVEGDDDEDDDDQECDEGIDQPVLQPKQEPHEFEPIKQPVKPSMNLLSPSFFFDDDSFEQHAVTDAQQLFPFNQDCMNYGYGWT